MKFIDLFAGAGGLSEGFIRQGFEPVAHVEMDEAACNTLRTRVAYHYLKSTGQEDFYTAYLMDEIGREELYSAVPKELLDSVINSPISGKCNPKIHRGIERQLDTNEVDLMVGGPPCQAYSLAGRSRSKSGMEGDPRNYLYIHYAKYLERYNPKMFLFENVLGLKSAGKGIYLRNMEKLFLTKGYKMHLFTVEANNFGVLQKRKRVIIVGWKDDFVPNLPDLEAVRVRHNSTVSDVFDDLPLLGAGDGIDKFSYYRLESNRYLRRNMVRNGIEILTQHVARPHTEQDKEIYRIAVSKWNNEKERLDYSDLPDRLKTHNNQASFLDRFKVVAADQNSSQTVVAHIAKDGHYYIHPDINQNRSITVREAARLQSFPDDYYFEGVKEGPNRTAAFKQIGNAVPPVMAQAIASKIKELL